MAKLPQLVSNKIKQEANNTKQSLVQIVFGSILAELEKTGRTTDDLNPYLVMKYIQNKYQCFSEWETDEIKSLASFIQRIQSMTWNDVKKNKGLGYTQYDLKTADYSARKILYDVKKLISDDINFFELRVSQKARVHGFRVNAAFFIVLFDRNHDVFPE